MLTKTISLDSFTADGGPLKEAAGLISGGGVAVIPTETFYGLAVSACSRAGVEKIYALKKRDVRKALPLIASDLEMVEAMSVRLPDSFRILAAAFWPGPLTVVVEAADSLPDFIRGPGRTVAVRIPPLDPLRRLIQEVGCPLTATSANISGDREITTAREAAAAFDGNVDLLIDGGRTPGGMPSTIIDLTSEMPRILREGRIPSEKILAALAVERP